MKIEIQERLPDPFGYAEFYRLPRYFFRYRGREFAMQKDGSARLGDVTVSALVLEDDDSVEAALDLAIEMAPPLDASDSRAATEAGLYQSALGAGMKRPAGDRWEYPVPTVTPGDLLRPDARLHHLTGPTFKIVSEPVPRPVSPELFEALLVLQTRGGERRFRLPEDPA